MRRVLCLALMALFFLSTGVDLYAVEKVRFSVHIRTSPDYVMPVLAALEKGFWKESGVEVEYIGFESPAAQDTAVVAKAIDMGFVGLLGLIRAISAGVPYAWVADVMTISFSVWVPPGSPLRKPQDLKGVTVSITRYGADLHFMTHAFAKALGIEKDMKIVAAGGTPARIAAMRAGATAATTGSMFPMLPLLVKGEVRELVDMEEYLPRGTLAQGLFVRRELLEKKPEVARKVVKGYLRGAEFYAKNRDWAIEKMQKEAAFGYSAEAAKIAYPKIKYTDGKVDLKRIESTMAFLIEYGLVPKEKMPPIDIIYAKGLAE